MLKRGLILATVLALSSPAFAQEATPQLANAVKVGQDVIVRSDDGTTTRGIVIRITPESLMLTQGELQGSVPAQRIARVQKVDPWWHGAVVGASLGLITTAIMLNDCPKVDDECRTIAKGFGLIVITPPATIIGALLDRFTQKTLYEKR
jgi:hypothetical protein